MKLLFNKVRILAALLPLICAPGLIQQTRAQADTLVLNNPSSSFNENISQYCQFYVDSSGKLDIAAASNKPFLDPKLFHDKSWQNKRIKTFWIKFTVRNTGNTIYNLNFFTGRQDYMYFYSPVDSNTYKLSQIAGLMLDKGGRRRWNHFAFPLSIPALSTQTFYLKIINKNSFENPLEPVMLSNLELEKYRLDEIHLYQPYATVITILLGMLIILFCFMLVSYRQVRHKATAYYAIMVLGLIFYFALQLNNTPYQLSFFGNIPLLKYYWDNTALLFCYYFMYALFARAFLPLKTEFPILDVGFRYAAYIFGYMIIINLLLIIFNQYYFSSIFYGTVFFLAIIPTIIMYWILFRKGEQLLVKYFLMGSVSLLAGEIVSFILAILNEMEVINLPPEYNPQYFLLAGTVLELLFFAIGLFYKNKLIQLEKAQTQETLIQEFTENKKAQEKLNEDLELQVQEQTFEILNKSRELEEQRQMRLEVEYNKRLTEMELKAIRAQINPHFIFNCLNSIQLFIMQEDYNSAQKYLSDFSLLIRKTLEMSKLNFISLNDEVSYLTTYLTLEKMRFDDKMDYEILIDPDLTLNKVEVPSMLLQPYVENAVKHGINNQDNKGKLKLLFKEVKEDLICTIEDNGIGIKRTRELGMDSFRKHLSAGMELSMNRAELMNKMFNTDIHIEVLDKEEYKLGESGTIVKITIPQF